MAQHRVSGESLLYVHLFHELFRASAPLLALHGPNYITAELQEEASGCSMLAFAIVTMAAARNPNNEGYISDSKGRGSLSPGGGGGGGGSANNKSWRAHGVPGRGGRRKRPPPRPNHFLSVRIDNASIWENVSPILARLECEAFLRLWEGLQSMY